MLDLFSEDIVQMIAIFLSAKEVCYLAQCNKKLKSVIYKEQIFNALLMRDYPNLANDKPKDYTHKDWFQHLSTGIIYDWTELSTVDEAASEYFKAYIKNPLMDDPRIDSKLRPYYKEISNMFEEMRNMTFKENTTRIRKEFDKIKKMQNQRKIFQPDCHTLIISEILDKHWVHMSFTDNDNYMYESDEVRPDKIEEWYKETCKKRNWPISMVKFESKEQFRKNEVNMWSFHNHKYLIDMIFLGYDTEDDKIGGGYDYDVIVLVILDYQTKKHHILGCDGHAFIESTDYYWNDDNGNGSALFLSENINDFIDMSIKFMSNVYKRTYYCEYEEDNENEEEDEEDD